MSYWPSRWSLWGWMHPRAGCGSALSTLTRRRPWSPHVSTCERYSARGVIRAFSCVVLFLH
jgi:hypothetical protein